jgi:hypothetical protein
LADAILEMGRYNVCEEIVLDRLGREDCSALIAGEFPDHSFPPSLLNLLFDHSEGNALFITEMLRLLREDALVEKRSGTWRLAQPVEDLPLPRSVESVVVMRIERLEADLRRTLRYGSVEGERFLSTVLAGYDFLTDSAQEIKSSLEAHGITTTSLISDTWTADDLRDNLLTTRHDLNGVSAHFEHWRAWPADVESGELTSDDVIVASNNVSGTLLFSVGCHAGLNVPDSWDDDESALDFSQAFAGSGATWVANTGYGYGMDDAAALSERLMGNFVKELGRGSKVPIGRALIRAKQRYVNSASAASLGLYDEKILVETTLYGLPMARVTMPITTETTSPIQGGRVRTSSGPTAGPLSSQTVTVTTLFTEVTTSDGLFYTTTDNEVQASAGRPIQPRVSLDIARTGETARGALFLGGEHHDIEPFNPVIARPVTDTAMTEPLYTLSGWHPTEMAVINRVETAFETLERLVLVPGQFKNPGVERLWDRLTYEVYYSTNGEEDTVDPAIWRAEAAQLPDRVLFNVEVTDDSGIERVVVPYSLGGGTWSHLDLTYDPDEELWTGEFPMNEDDSVSYFVQAVDAAGNVAASDNKGFLFEPVTNNVYVPLILRGG